MSKSCSIFVGNVPYDAQEDELRDVFSKAGEVTSIRLVNDKETRQPKGYCFVDFADSTSRDAAIDKLNNVEYNGRRLRVDTAERELNRSHGREGGPDRPGPGGPPGPAPPGPNDAVPIPMPVISLADRLARIREHEAAEAARKAAYEQAELAELARFVETLTPQQLFHIIGEFQRLSIRAPEVARALVTENIQLCLVLQHAQFLLGLAEEAPLPTDPEVRERARNVKEKVFGVTTIDQPGAGMPGMPPVPGLGAPLQAGGLLGFPGLAASPLGAAPALAQLGALAQLLAQQQAAATAAAAAPAATAPPAPAPAAAPSIPNLGAAGNSEENRQQLLEQLTKLSPAQIDQLPHQTKIAVLGFLQTLPQS